MGRILIDACIPYEWERKPIEINLDEDVKAAWSSRAGASTAF